MTWECFECRGKVITLLCPFHAAAPALLDALEAAERALSAASIAGKSLYAAPVTLAARAAIALAKGEKS